MGLLTKDLILGKADRASKTVEVEEWNGSVILKEMSGKGRGEYDNYLFQNADKDGNIKNIQYMKLFLITLCLVDEDGNRLFAPSELEKIGEKSSSAIDFLYEECMVLNKLKKEDIDDSKKNLEPTEN